jgi:hypothetical protein
MTASSVSWVYTQLVGIIGRKISQSQSHYRYTEQHKHNKKTQNILTKYRHPCLDWDLNPRSRLSSERRQFKRFFFNSHSGVWSPDWVHSARRPLLTYCTCPGLLWGLWRTLMDWRLAGEPKYSEKNCPSAILSTTNPTWPDPGANPGRRAGKPATNCLSYGAAWIYALDRAATLISIKSM